MAVDVVDLLRELDFGIDMWDDRSWLLRAPDGHRYLCEVAPVVDRITSTAARYTKAPFGAQRMRPLVAGRTITESMLERARRGELDVITEQPLRLIVRGHVYSDDTVSGTSYVPGKTPRRHRGRPPWIRWATMRCLLLAPGPMRQSEIAAALGSSQQAVSIAFQQLAGLVKDTGSGFVASDKPVLLQKWTADYTGPSGQAFGWYNLDPVVEQTERAAEIAALYEVEPLISGDVAADRLAPWKLPAAGKVYVKSPVDLASDGFMPAPLNEATLVTCIPQDPTIWKLLDIGPGSTGTRSPLADAAIVYWDVLHGKDVDSTEAASKLAKSITG